MKKIFKYSMIAFAALALAACGKEEPFPGGDMAEGEGQLSTKNLVVNLDTKENEVRSGSRAVDVASFNVEILRGSELVQSYVYSEMPEIVTLPVGNYTARVRSGEAEPAAWEAPYYEGTQDFEIKNRQVTEVETVVCKFANVRVTILYTDALKSHMSEDAYVSVEMGEADAEGNKPTLDFSKNETRSGYFKYVEGSSTLVACFNGTVDGVEEATLRPYSDVKPGNHYKITFSYRQGELPDDAGSVSFNGVNVDVTIEEENMNFNADDDDDYVTDATNPWDNDNTGGGDDPEPGTPSEGGPTATPEDPLTFDSVVDVSEGKFYYNLDNDDDPNNDHAIVNVHSDTGLTKFIVKIDSPILTDEFLGDVGLSTTMDLVNPGSTEKGLTDLGLPVNVGGKKDVVFDISSFMPMLQGISFMNPGQQHKFIMTVADSTGENVYTLTLFVQ